MAIKEIRISQADGTVVDADREVHVTTRPNKGGPDKVKWVVEPKAAGQPVPMFDVIFGSSSDPFAAPTMISVPSNGSSPEREVLGLPGNYKYSVRRVSTGDMTDDPNIIIRS